MTVPFKPSRWDVQPSLTAAPDLWEGCKYVRPAWDHAEQKSVDQVGYELVTGKAFDPPNNYLSDQGWQITEIGPVYQVVTTSSQSNFTFPTGGFDWSETKVISSAIVCQPNDGTINNLALMNVLDAASQSILQSFLRTPTAFRLNAADLKYRCDITAPTVALTDWLLVVAEYDDNAKVAKYWYKNLTNGDFGFDDDTTGTAPDVPFDYLVNEIRSAKSKVAFQAAWNRGMSGADIERLMADPFCMIRPGPLLFTPAFSSSGPSGPINWSTVYNNLRARGLTSRQINDMASERLTALGYTQKGLPDKLKAYTDATGKADLLTVYHRFS